MSHDPSKAENRGGRTKVKKRRSHQPIHARRIKQRLAVTLFVLLFLALIGGTLWWIRKSLETTSPENICSTLSSHLSSVTGLDVELSNAHYEGGHLKIAKLEAAGSRGSLIQGLHATQLSIPASLSQRLSGKWHLGAIHADAALLILSQPSPPAPTESQPIPTTLLFPEKELIKELRVGRVEIGSLEVQWGEKENRISASQAILQRTGSDWTTQFRTAGGSIKVEGWPPLPLQEFSGQIEGSSLQIETLKIDSVTSGIKGNAAGAIALSYDQSTQLSGEARGILLSELLPRPTGWGEWANGKLDIAWRYHQNSPSQEATQLKPGLSGTIQIHNLQLSNVPLLHSLAEATKIPEFRHATFDDPIQCNLRWNDDVLTIHRINGAGRKTLGIGGTFTTSGPAGDLDGHILIGLNTEILNSIHNGSPSFFSPPTADGRRWSRVRLTGTRTSPHDDFHARLKSHLEAEPTERSSSSEEGSSQENFPTKELTDDDLRKQLLDWYIQSDG